MEWKKKFKFRKLGFSDYLCLVIVVGMIVTRLVLHAKKKEPPKGDFYFNDRFDSKLHYETEGAGRSIFLDHRK